MDRRERERILGEWGVRDDTVRGRVQRDALARAPADSPLVGRPLRRRWRNFVAEADAYVASLGGPLPYMQRLRAIHDETEEHAARLERRWLELARECRGDEAEFARRWRRTAERWNFAAVNELAIDESEWEPDADIDSDDPAVRDATKCVKEAVGG